MWAGPGGWGAWPIHQAAFANIPTDEGSHCDLCHCYNNTNNG